jgi:DNA-binding NarL/FixJ family response regulator
MRVLIVSDLYLYRGALDECLCELCPTPLVEGASSGEEAIFRSWLAPPDIALVDSAMAEWPRAILGLCRAVPDLKVLAISVPDDESSVLHLAEAGVAGYVMRDANREELLEAFVTVARGGVVCPPRIASLLMRQAAVSSMATVGDVILTAREREVLSLVGAGLSNKEIARRLYIELATVKNHVHNILEKLRVPTRQEALEEARRATRSVNARGLLAKSSTPRGT